MQMPALAMTDHGNVFGAYDFWQQGTAAGRQADHRHGGLRHPGHVAGSSGPGCAGADGGEDDVSGGGAFTHMTLLAETTAGMHNLFRLSSLASLEGFFYKPRADRELLERYATGIIATTGCPSGEIQTRLRIGDYDGRQARRRRAAGHLRPRQLLLRADGPRPRHRAAGPRRPAPACRRAVDAARSPPTTCTTPSPRTPTRTRCCCASSPARRWPTRTGSSSTRHDFYLKSPQEMRELLARAARRPATTPC